MKASHEGGILISLRETDNLLRLLIRSVTISSLAYELLGKGEQRLGELFFLCSQKAIAQAEITNIGACRLLWSAQPLLSATVSSMVVECMHDMPQGSYSTIAP